MSPINTARTSTDAGSNTPAARPTTLRGALTARTMAAMMAVHGLVAGCVDPGHSEFPDAKDSQMQADGQQNDGFDWVPELDSGFPQTDTGTPSVDTGSQGTDATSTDLGGTDAGSMDADADAGTTAIDGQTAPDGSLSANKPGCPPNPLIGAPCNDVPNGQYQWKDPAGAGCQVECHTKH